MKTDEGGRAVDDPAGRWRCGGGRRPDIDGFRRICIAGDCDRFGGGSWLRCSRGRMVAIVWGAHFDSGVRWDRRLRLSGVRLAVEMLAEMRPRG